MWEKNRILSPGLWIAIVKRPQTLLELIGTRERDRRRQFRDFRVELGGGGCPKGTLRASSTRNTLTGSTAKMAGSPRAGRDFGVSFRGPLVPPTHPAAAAWRASSVAFWTPKRHDSSALFPSLIRTEPGDARNEWLRLHECLMSTLLPPRASVPGCAGRRMTTP